MSSKKPPYSEVEALARVVRLAALEANRLRYRKVGNELDRLGGWLEFETRSIVQVDLVDLTGSTDAAALLDAVGKQLPKRPRR